MYFETSTLVIHVFVPSPLNNLSALPGEAPAHTVLAVQQVQNSVARLVAGARRYMTPLPLSFVHRTGFLFAYRCQFKVLMLSLKVVHGQASAYVVDMLIPCRLQRSLRSADKLQLVAPRRRTNGGDRAFSVPAQILQNSPPLVLRQSPRGF